MYPDGYIPPILTIDGLIFRVENGSLEVMLIRRQADPFKGALALPGGYNAAGETTTDALDRVIKKKCGIGVADLKYVEQLYTFDTVARDPRGHAVSVAYIGIGTGLEPSISENTQEPAFYPVASLPKLAYDHYSIIKYAHERLRSKLTYTNTAFALMPQTFTLTELQTTYEAVFVRKLDKRNFRKKYLSLDLIEETGEIRQDGAHRPARLYRFRKQELESIERNFD